MSTLYTALTAALRAAEQHNGLVMVRPEVILWPDPEGVFQPLADRLREDFPAFLTLGPYAPERTQGPAVWIKCKVARTLPHPAGDAIPIVYLPGVSRQTLKNPTDTPLDLHPLLEYVYTGAVFLQENGREWTPMAFLQNAKVGLNLRVAQDTITREALKETLLTYAFDEHAFTHVQQVDATHLHQLRIPRFKEAVLNWLNGMEAPVSPTDSATFAALCKAQYGFTPVQEQKVHAAHLLGLRQRPWNDLWDLYAASPQRYPNLPELLRLAQPRDLRTSLFSAPRDSWPNVNEEEETKLRAALVALHHEAPPTLRDAVARLEDAHGERRSWVWAELGQAPLAHALQFLAELATRTRTLLPTDRLDALRAAYESTGYRVDQAVRRVFEDVSREDDLKALTGVVQALYVPWVTQATLAFQRFAEAEPALFRTQPDVSHAKELVLFVDALRYETAVALADLLRPRGMEVQLSTGWSALPSVTATAKPAISPLREDIHPESPFDEFGPAFRDGRKVRHDLFGRRLEEAGFRVTTSHDDLQPGQRQWREIGTLDKTGHSEQAGLARRIPELLEQIVELLDRAAQRGLREVTLVTDHGWLFLPGGLPKTDLHERLVETRWGRCALVKEGVQTNLVQLPWRWNPAVFVAYATGISCFYRNEAYAHGGLSLQECLVPVLRVTIPQVQSRTRISAIRWQGLRCTVELDPYVEGCTVDVRTRKMDPKTTLCLSVKPHLNPPRFVAMVDDRHEGSAAFVVLLDPQGRIIDERTLTVGEA